MEILEYSDQIWIALAMMAATTFVHGVFVAAAAAILRFCRGRVRGVMRFLRDTFALVILSIWLLAAHIIEIVMWAYLYLRFDLFADLEPALYFSAASYTTLGFGDVILDPPWRLLSGATAANGLLLFGLSAAVLFDVAGQLRLAGGRR